MKKIILKILVTALTLGGGVAFAETEGVVCTADAKLCPDGSYVGRVGPKCEFKQCPNSIKPVPPKPLQQLKDTRNEIKAEIKTVRSDAKTEIEDLRERMASSTRQIRDQVKENIKNRVGHRFDRMLARFLATIEREEAIIVKIVSRLEKI